MISCTVPTYCCTRPLEKKQAATCYGEDSAAVTVSCDGCGESYSGDDVIWHCGDCISSLHPNGYDLCDRCAQKQLAFDPLRGLTSVKRDERHSIRVTMLYYHATTTPVIDEQMVTQIVHKLATLEKMGRAQAPNAVPAVIPAVIPRAVPGTVPTPYSQAPRQAVSGSLMESAVHSVAAPTAPVPVVNAADYKVIENALSGLELSEYLGHFHREKVKDSELMLLNEGDLRHLFGALGPAMWFREWLKQNKGRLMNGGTVPAVDEAEFRGIVAAFGRMKGVEAMERERFMAHFKSHGITDEMVSYLSEEDWNMLIPDMRTKVMFKREFVGGDSRQHSAVQSAVQRITAQAVQQQRMNGQTVTPVSSPMSPMPPSMQKQTVTTSASYLF